MNLESAIADVGAAFCGVEGVHTMLDKFGVVPSTSLEVGAGSGKLSMHLVLKHGTFAHATDLDEDMVTYQHHLWRAVCELFRAVGTSDVPFAHRFVPSKGDARCIKAEDSTFDLVFNEGSIEHFSRPDQEKWVREMARMSKRWVLFLVPDAAHPESQRVAREVCHNYEGMPDHEAPLTGEECDALVQQAGLELVAREIVRERWWFVLAEKRVS